MPATAPLPEPAHLRAAVETALATSPYVPSKRVTFAAGEGRVRLEGRVGTFFEKQMAQEVVRRIDGVEEVENLLQVAW